jgi:tetratricopeptide (TPR) repeat protein
MVDRDISTGSRRTLIWICVGLTALTWLVFGQTLSHQFVNYDDQTYVYENSEVKNGLTAHGIAWAFTHTVSHNWHPLTVISHMIDCQLFGLRPGGHHFANVAWHTVAVLLLFFALRDLTGTIWASAFVSALFAIHPLRAESVAWIAERKDILSGIFFFLTLSAYARYTRHRSFARYLIVATFFVLGLMCKSMLVTTPFVLLLLDYWPLRRVERLRDLFHFIREKIPLFGLAALTAVVTFIAQKGAIRSSDEMPFAIRISNAIVNFTRYLLEMVWPMRLAPFYPFPRNGIPLWQLAFSIVLLVSITVLLIALGAKRPQRGYLITGWLWYVAMLLPVIGIIQVGLQGHADRYTYLPQIGLYILITWALVDLSASWSRRREILGGFAAIIIVLLSWRGANQVTFWRTSESLWTHATAVTGENALAETSLADALIARGRCDEAIPHAREAVRIQPDSADAHNNLAIALSRVGRQSEAIAHARTSAALNANRPGVYYNLATLLLQSGEIDEAIANYRNELQVQPQYAEARNNLGIALSQKGDVREAIAQWQETLQVDPDNLDAQCNLAWVFSTSSQKSFRNGAKAIELAQCALKLSKGKSPRIYRLLAAGYAESGRFSEAVETAQRGLQLAIDQGDALLADTFRNNIEQFRGNSPLRDPGM